MRVKCVINNVEDIKNADLKQKLKRYINLPEGDDILKIGKEYIVQCIASFDDCWFYYLHTIETLPSPWSYPIDFFIILDNSLPNGWKVSFRNENGKYVLKRISFPEWADDDDFFEKLYEDDDLDAMLAYITNLEQTQHSNEGLQPARYTARIFGCELAKKLLEEPFDSASIAHWCEQLYKEKHAECDDLLKAIISRLSIMENPQLAYSEERLKDIANGFIHKSKVVEPESMAFSLNDQVSIKKIAPSAYRPGEPGVLCWFQTIDSEENAALFGSSIGSEVYFVRFEDGEVLEIPKENLIKHDFLKK